MEQPMIEVAYRILQDQSEPVSFLNLYKQVSDELGFTPAQHDDNIAHFFSDLSLDNRFISRPKNTWDLKKRHSTKDTKIDLEALSLDEEDEDGLAPLNEDEEIEEEEETEDEED